MTFSNYLKGQLTDFVESYRKYFWQTSGTVLTYTVLCFVAMSLLFKFSKFDATSTKTQISLLSYFFSRYSVNETYSIVDLAKSIFLLFVSFFSISLTRFTLNESNEKEELSFATLQKQLLFKDIITLIGVLLLCSIIDFGLFRLDNFFKNNINNYEFHNWAHAILFLLRIYVPLIFFSIALYRLMTGKFPKLNFSKIIFLFVSLWLFNEFAYEVSIFVRSSLFTLLLSPFEQDKEYLYESILGITLIAFYFLGYHSAMTGSLRQLEEEVSTSVAGKVVR